MTPLRKFHCKTSQFCVGSRLQIFHSQLATLSHLTTWYQGYREGGRGDTAEAATAKTMISTVSTSSKHWHREQQTLKHSSAAAVCQSVNLNAFLRPPNPCISKYTAWWLSPLQDGGGDVFDGRLFVRLFCFWTSYGVNFHWIRGTV